jgi:hypothetical protein
MHSHVAMRHTFRTRAHAGLMWSAVASVRGKGLRPAAPLARAMQPRPPPTLQPPSQRAKKKTTPRTHPTSPPVLLIPLIYLNGAALSMLSVPGLSARRKCPPLRASPATIQTQIPLGTHPMLPPKVPAVLV